MRESFGGSRPDDFLGPSVGEVPAFRALLRAVEARLYVGLELARPILDLGCGDGHFAAVAFGGPVKVAPQKVWRLFGGPVEVGLDPSLELAREAAGRRAHQSLLVGRGEALPLASGSFGTVIANSVLEHIPQVEMVLREVARVLAKGGSFIFTVPSEHYQSFLLGSKVLGRLGLSSLSRAYPRWFNRYAPHFHLLPPERWEEMLKGAGLEVMRHNYYFSARATQLFEALHYWSVPSLLTRRLFGRWTLIPRWRSLSLMKGLVSKFYREEAPNLAMGACSFFLCRKVGDEGREG